MYYHTLNKSTQSMHSCIFYLQDVLLVL